MRHSWLIAMALTMVFVSPAQAKLEDTEQNSSVAVKVDLSTQTMRVVVGGQQLYSWKVSSGGRGYTTPSGSYKPIRMHRMWYSKKYDNSPMPHSIFFHGGYAIHGTDSLRTLGRPASHGCVRLHPTNAAKLYKLVKKHGAGNTRISISGTWNWKKNPYRKKKVAKRRYNKHQSRRVAARRQNASNSALRYRMETRRVRAPQRRRVISQARAKRFKYREWKRVRTPSGRVIRYVWYY